ncbi:NADP-dependent oxidoreductase [Amycolatopsis pithecellobii]|uniref:Zinc-binding dehydrogenase n=1 Tax=Amycolatopsis pithecellobii TaxID=664692 RepID=A0A6N7Z0D4_9PSEU|nr:NADP-dependent oxidoreductase [Amycolatopsis pithecellobii]MTD52884.1 zinc-binding dehydrogenase [Amycolatopsis pithecellobii]
MRAVACDDFGGPEQLRVRELDRPPLGPNNVLVRLAYAGVNPGDSRIRQGQFVPRGRHIFPLVLGLEGAGTVEEIGISGSPFELGQAVYGFFMHDYVGDGTYAEFAPVRSRNLIPVPDGVSLRDAAAVACAGTTALVLVDELLGVGPGDTVVVLGAAGGVGHFAVQLAVAAGARVIGVARSSNHDFVRELGAHEVVDYGRDDLPAVIGKLAPDGVDSAVDPVGGAAQESLAGIVRQGGRIASCVHPARSTVFGERDQALLYRFLEATPDRLARLNEHVTAGRVRPRITGEYTLADAAKAHAAIDAGNNRGKIVLRIG